MQIIVEEAGGKATDIDGHQLIYNGDFQVRGHIISNGGLHDQLVEMTARARKAT